MLRAVDFQVHSRVDRSVLHGSNVFIGHEILLERFVLVWLQPGEIWLVICVHTGHEFDVWSVFVGQITIPGLSELAAAPRPLLFTRGDVMIGDMQDTGLYSVIVTTNKVVVRMVGHIRGGHGYVFVPRYIYAGGIIHFIICAR